MASLPPSDNGENSELPRVCQVQEAANSESHPDPRATQREEKGGYECEFVVPPPKLLQSECSICLLVLREPHIVSCCGQSFCETCIGRIQRDGKPCPLCNKPGFMTVANGGLKRALNEFQVRCPHRELGCEWVTEMGKLDQHLNVNPQPEHQLEGCQFTSVECIHCKDHMRRCVIAGHQNERCPKRPYTCEYCEEYETTFENVVDHWAECKCYLLPCPNNCSPSGSGIERQNLEHHMKEECSLAVVECDFHYAGCGVKLPRKDMAGHMKEESVAHNSLLAAENWRLARQLLERDEKMQQLMQQNSELSNSIDQQQKAYKELVATTDQQLEANRELRKELTQVKETLQKANQDLAEQQQRASQELKKELTQAKDEQQRAHRELAEKVTHTAEQQQIANQELKEELTQTKETHQKHLASYQKLASKVALHIQGVQEREGLMRSRSLILPIDIKMAEYKKFKDENRSWCSDPFYTHVCGYKMSLCVVANGAGDSKGTHVSVYTHLQCGEFDSDLKWPFRGVITIRVLNQLGVENHFTATSDYNDATPDSSAAQVAIGERAMGWGQNKFIPHSRLNFDRAKNCQYLKNDCLIFRVSIMMY